MSDLDLTEAQRAVRLELARVIERGIAADIGEYAVRAALPHILEALREKAWAELEGAAYHWLVAQIVLLAQQPDE